MAQKFIAALMNLVSAAPKPGALKIAVETVGFQHLDVDAWHGALCQKRGSGSDCSTDGSLSRRDLGALRTGGDECI